jgi:hypothetical protein
MCGFCDLESLDHVEAERSSMYLALHQRTSYIAKAVVAKFSFELLADRL